MIALSELLVVVGCLIAETGGNSQQTLSEFLAASNLCHLEDILVANGFDELDFMVIRISFLQC